MIAPHREALSRVGGLLALLLVMRWLGGPALDRRDIYELALFLLLLD